MQPTQKPWWYEGLDTLWNEHDGTHFYKDEFREFIAIVEAKILERAAEVVKNRIIDLDNAVNDDDDLDESIEKQNDLLKDIAKAIKLLGKK